MDEKQCKKCRRIKPIEEFEKHKGCRLGISGRCRDCALAYYKNRYQEKRVELDEQHARWDKANRKKVIAYRKKWRRENWKRLSADQSRRHKESKIQAFNAYGGPVCVCCGETEFIFLTIDHKNNDGRKHRRERGATHIYKWLRDNGYPPGFQVLCFNCNSGRHINGGICPHQVNIKRMFVVNS